MSKHNKRPDPTTPEAMAAPEAEMRAVLAVPPMKPGCAEWTLLVDFVRRDLRGMPLAFVWGKTGGEHFIYWDDPDSGVHARFEFSGRTSSGMPVYVRPER